MRRNVKTVLINAMRAVLSALYAICKLWPVDDRKVVFLSRQSSSMTLDFRLLEQAILEECPDAHIVGIFNRMQPGWQAKFMFAIDVLRSLWHLATARVCVLDSYWPAVSLLKHRPSLTVIQMWHSLGKVKRSGLCTVGLPGGRPADLARALHMHEGYDWIVAGSSAWNPFYCDSFGCEESQILNFGLPRMDALVPAALEKTAESVLRRCPELKHRRVVLYAPTFRRTGSAVFDDFAEALADRDYELVVKAHPNQAICVPGALTCDGVAAFDLLSVADVVITDYSAIALEAAAANIPTLYYLYDLEEYRQSTGMNIDIEKEMPSCVHVGAQSLAAAISDALEGRYPLQELERYRRKFLISDMGHSAPDLARFIVGNLHDKE